MASKEKTRQILPEIPSLGLVLGTGVMLAIVGMFVL
jgi:hypothetical protein